MWNMITIREAVVEELVMLGARVHTCGRNEAQLQERLHEWQAKGFPVTTSVCDVSSPDQRAKLMETVSSLFQGKLNILVSFIYTSRINMPPVKINLFLHVF